MLPPNITPQQLDDAVTMLLADGYEVMFRTDDDAPADRHVIVRATRGNGDTIMAHGATAAAALSAGWPRDVWAPAVATGPSRTSLIIRMTPDERSVLLAYLAGRAPQAFAEALADYPDIAERVDGLECWCGHRFAEHTTASPDVGDLLIRRMCDREDCMCCAYREAAQAGLTS